MGYESSSEEEEKHGGRKGRRDGAAMCARSNYRVMSMLQETRDQMFVNRLRTTMGAYSGICHDIFAWLRAHGPEKERATEPGSGSGGESGPESGPVSTPITPAKREHTKLEGVQRSLRGMLDRMTRQGGMSSDESDGDEEMNDEDIQWKRLFLSCYVWMKVEDATDGSGSGMNTAEEV